MNAAAIRDQFEHAAAHEPRMCVSLTPEARAVILRALDSEDDLPLRGKVQAMRAQFIMLAVSEMAAIIQALEGFTEAAWLRAQFGSKRARLIANAQDQAAFAP